MKKTVKITALAGAKETIFIDNMGDLYSATEKSAEFVLNVKEFNYSKNAISLTVRKLKRQGYKIASNFSINAYKAFKEARKVHLKEKFEMRDFMEFSPFNY